MDFRIGSVPLSVQGRFFIMTVLLGLNERDPARLAIWVAIVFVSIVVHEMGHALMGMVFGYKPAIVLHGMGGHTTFGEGRWTETTMRSVLISLAGPFAGFLFAGIVVGIQVAGVHPEPILARWALVKLLQVNVGWGIFNLVPLLPLDGGNVMNAVLKKFAVNRGEAIARIISIVLCVGMGLYAATNGEWWLLYLAGIFGFSNIQAYRSLSQAKIDRPVAGAVEAAYGALNRGNAKEAIALLGPVLFSKNVDADVRRAGLEVYIVALLQQQRWSDIVRAVERERDLFGAEETRSVANMLRREGRTEEADRVEKISQQAARFGDFRA